MFLEIYALLDIHLVAIEETLLIATVNPVNAVLFPKSRCGIGL